VDVYQFTVIVERQPEGECLAFVDEQFVERLSVV
jgi:hypothetical protein